MRKREPTPRKGVYELYWYFAAERQAIFEKRLKNLPSPWTNDLILKTYKFCNVFRAADRVSQYLIREVCYHKEDSTAEERIFQIVAFRIFSNIDTWNCVRVFLGQHPTLQNLADGSLTKALEHAAHKNGKLYTNAFILCATNAYSQKYKYLNHIELLRHMFLLDSLSQKILLADSLYEINRLIHAYPLMGDFMSYQIAIDLNYSELVNFSENEFTVAGPGAIRGIKKCFVDLGDYSVSEIILWMVKNQHSEFNRLQLSFSGLFGRQLHAIDCQGLFCETDKYCRQAVPELISQRTYIKSKFRQNTNPLIPFFPPKWDINKKIQSTNPLKVEQDNQINYSNKWCPRTDSNR